MKDKQVKRATIMMNLGIRGQLLGGFGTVIALLAGVGYIGWDSTNQFARDAENIYLNQVQGAVALANSESALWKLRYGFPQFLVQPEKRKDIIAEEPKLYALINENLEKFEKLDLTPEEREAYDKLTAIYSKYVAARPRWFELIQAGKIEEAATYRAATTTPFGAETVKNFGDLINLQRQVAEKQYKSIVQEKQEVTIWLTLWLLLALGLSIFLTWWLSTNITKPVLKSVNQIASSSNEIATTVEQQERTVAQQASSVNETTTTMEEMGASSRQAAEQAEASSLGARQALTLAENGTKAVQETMEAMGALNEQVRAIAEQIINLSEQTGQIAGISDLVADLANQTNMLALNAAVEAARAGEQGKGFGVVASEIRKLADESKKAAEKINGMVLDVQASMNSTVMVTDEGTKKTNTSIKLAQETAETFNGVTDAINSVFMNSQQLSLSAKQQAVAIQQMLSAMNAINLGAKETNTGISQVKASTNLLTKAAEELKKASQQIFLQTSS